MRKHLVWISVWPNILVDQWFSKREMLLTSLCRPTGFQGILKVGILCNRLTFKFFEVDILVSRRPTFRSWPPCVIDRPLRDFRSWHCVIDRPLKNFQGWQTISERSRHPWGRQFFSARSSNILEVDKLFQQDRTSLWSIFSRSINILEVDKHFQQDRTSLWSTNISSKSRVTSLWSTNYFSKVEHPCGRQFFFSKVE